MGLSTLLHFYGQTIMATRQNEPSKQLWNTVVDSAKLPDRDIKSVKFRSQLKDYLCDNNSTRFLTKLKRYRIREETAIST